MSKRQSPAVSWGQLLSAGLTVALPTACAQDAARPSPHTAAEAESIPVTAPASFNSLRVKTRHLDQLQSPYFSAVEFTFENPSNRWCRIDRISLEPDRRIHAPEFELIEGERLRVWQLATRDALSGKAQPAPALLDALAPTAPPEPNRHATPPAHLLSLPFSVAPGLSAKRWVVLHSSQPNSIAGHDLVLEYQLDSGKVEQVLLSKPPQQPVARNH